MGTVALQASSVAGSVFLSFDENGAGDVVGCAVATFRQDSTGHTDNDFATLTAVLTLTAGDRLRLRVNTTAGGPFARR